MALLSGYGLSVDLPPGWDGSIARRSDAGALPVLHASSMPLPAGRADSGGGAVERLGWGESFVCLLEHEPACAATALFAAEGVPVPLAPDSFTGHALQGMRPVQSGTQRFFSVHGRAFCLFVALGEHARRHRLLPPVNSVLATLAIEPLTGPQ